MLHQQKKNVRSPEHVDQYAAYVAILAVDWANLAVIDLSKATTFEGRKTLVEQVHDAIKNDGFLYIINHGIEPEQVSLLSWEFQIYRYPCLDYSDVQSF